MAAQTMDECVDEIFRTQKNVGNAPRWRTAKTRFYDGSLSLHAKKKLLEDYNYVVVEPAKYEKKEKKSKVKK